MVTNIVPGEFQREINSGHNRVRFILPDLPGSVNEIYAPIRSIYSPVPRWGVKAEWKLWGTNMWPYVPAFEIREHSIIRVDRIYYYEWFTKLGKWRKADVANMDKLLFDIISRKIGVDDLYFKEGMMSSRDSDQGVVEVTLTEVEEEKWKARQRATG